ncbi:Uncharacterised protein [Serratia rubidaea]|nr:Uncharacterised protein [Serratia rubidaea]
MGGVWQSIFFEKICWHCTKVQNVALQRLHRIYMPFHFLKSWGYLRLLYVLILFPIVVIISRLLNEEKKNAVLNDFSSHPDILFTDHYDDLPLIQMCKFSYLVSPDKSSKEKFIRVLSVDAYKIID